MPIDTKYYLNKFRINNVKEECPACGRPEWSFGNGVVTLPYVQEEGAASQAAEIRAVPIVCKNCSYIRLFLDKEV